MLTVDTSVNWSKTIQFLDVVETMPLTNENINTSVCKGRDDSNDNRISSTGNDQVGSPASVQNPTETVAMNSVQPFKCSTEK